MGKKIKVVEKVTDKEIHYFEDNERSDADFERGGNPTFDKKGLDDFMVRKYGPDKSKWPGGRKR